MSVPHPTWIGDVLATALRCRFKPNNFDSDAVELHSTERDHVRSMLESRGFRVQPLQLNPRRSVDSSTACVAWIRDDGSADDGQEPLRPVVVIGGSESALLIARSATDVIEIARKDFSARCSDEALSVEAPLVDIVDPDADQHAARESKFGFSWFMLALMRHKQLWREVLLASLVIQLLALGLPLITQVVIDKVVVHRTFSTLVVVGVAMTLFMVFTAALTWTRQYLILHVGNRVDAALGSHVFAHLLKLPPAYFQHRATGVIAARLHGVETIREFIASAGVTLVLDLPFLLIFVAVMFCYSATLSVIVLSIVALLATLSLAVSPVFQRRLNEQFMRGARNQAFVTEYVAAIETVKSLQIEPQLNHRYAALLGDALEASMRTKQLANGYNVVAQTLDQLMSLTILCVGAWIVMTTDITRGDAFTIGMLVAFQMFAQRVSQPMMRLVGLWQQFQQAKLSITRLGDLMNTPTEPYAFVDRRSLDAKPVEIVADRLAFRYAEHLPLLYEQLSFTARSGTLTAIMGPSGCGKSTLTKLMQGFCWPTSGVLRVDGSDSRYLAADELRRSFGVVPQETVLFSGTVRENLEIVAPLASFDDIVTACKLAQVHDFIAQLPQGYDTPLGERGAGLSGGQKQRLAIARALLKKPRVLIFDEATANLDAATVEAFVKTVNALKGQVTVIFITHALPRSLHVDQIIKLGPKPEVLTAMPTKRAASDRTDEPSSPPVKTQLSGGSNA